MPAFAPSTAGIILLIYMEFPDCHENVVKLDQLLDSAPGSIPIKTKKSWVHVWVAPLDVPVRVREALRAVLPLDEVDYIQRRLRQIDRARLVVAHGLLRHILALYSGELPVAMMIQREAGKKPRLPHHEGIDFSLSHSKETAAIAVGDISVGVDVEKVVPRPSLAKIRERLRKEEDSRGGEPMHADTSIQGFYECWTYREACIKATGSGIRDLCTHQPVWSSKFLPYIGYIGALVATCPPREYQISRIIPC